MKKISRSKLIKGILVGMLGITVVLAGVGYYYYATYNSINIRMNKCLVLEYGTKEYKVKDLIGKVDGKIVSIDDQIDTNVLGKQEVIVTVEKNYIQRLLMTFQKN